MSNPQLKDVLRQSNIAAEHLQPVRQRFAKNVCQCCGYERREEEDPECVCDGLDWHMDRDGRIECAAHKFTRAMGLGKTVFGISKKR